MAPDAKAQARTQIGDAIAGGGYGKRELIVRTNGLNTAWGYEDLVFAATSGADAVLLPKVRSADLVRQAEQVLVASGAPAGLKIWCMMETPLAMLNAKEIAGASPRLGAFVMGTSDLAKDLHAAHTRDRLPMITSLGLCLLAARAYGLAILDGVYLDLNDDEGFAASCRQGVELGFDGKTLIHPKTLAATNAAFGPRRTRWRIPAESSTPSRPPSPRARAWCWSTASWSRTCTSKTPAGWWPWPKRSKPWKPKRPPEQIFGLSRHSDRKRSERAGQ